LLSIKPEFAEKILRREKRFEFRKTGFKDETAVDRVVMYASSPTQRIVGLFTVEDVVEMAPEALWEHFGDESGIREKERFMRYFAGKEQGYAIEIGDVQQLASPIDPRSHIEEFRPPVSFQYIRGEIKALLDRLVFQPSSSIRSLD
jgi:type I restriction enzyme S subunit